ncbi:unnamed protein product [Pleuronectes platessa]|uniref:Uncharacterized protein n=1 Tax=Pleuronectes platessa TaxID=8262 RepID=A0A9N7Y9F1_PLEPL|nr:unnamed protein product [Pleuronectes platessa]
MSLLYQLFVVHCTADLHFPSPSLSPRFAQLGLSPRRSPASVLFLHHPFSEAPVKAGKLSLLPVKVSIGWAAGLPLSLWRMILWMNTEEMALGELLERLRTVAQSIGGPVSL